MSSGTEETVMAAISSGFNVKNTNTHTTKSDANQMHNSVKLQI